MIAVVALIGVLGMAMMIHITTVSNSTDEIARVTREIEFIAESNQGSRSIRSAFFAYGGLEQYLRDYKLKNPAFNWNDKESLRKVMEEFLLSQNLIPNIKVNSVKLLKFSGRGENPELVGLESGDRDLSFDLASIRLKPESESSASYIDVLIAR